MPSNTGETLLGLPEHEDPVIAITTINSFNIIDIGVAMGTGDRADNVGGICAKTVETFCEERRISLFPRLFLRKC